MSQDKTLLELKVEELEKRVACTEREIQKQSADKLANKIVEKLRKAEIRI